MDFPAFLAGLAAVREVVAERQRRAGLGHAVRIVAVTKTHGPDAVRAAWDGGLRDVGENRVQEALPKQEETRDLPLEWHLIGGLQRNKARQAVGRFALIHSVDRLELAAELDRRVADGAQQAILVQVNCSDEPQKGGVSAADLPELLDGVRALARLDLRGLMTMAAYDADESAQRRTFARLRSLRDASEQRGHALPELSMGMSGDYPAAVEEGATILRLGTVLFGEREAATEPRMERHTEDGS
jgi:PLP dependent protein